MYAHCWDLLKSGECLLPIFGMHDEGDLPVLMSGSHKDKIVLYLIVLFPNSRIGHVKAVSY